VLLGTSDIWPFHPEKCLRCAADWADANPEALTRLLRALMRAQMICDQPDQAEAVVDALADIEASPCHVEAVRAALPGGTGLEPNPFSRRRCRVSRSAHAVWFLRQMRRWGWLSADTNLAMTGAGGLPTGSVFFGRQDGRFVRFTATHRAILRFPSRHGANRNRSSPQNGF